MRGAGKEWKKTRSAGRSATWRCVGGTGAAVECVRQAVSTRQAPGSYWEMGIAIAYAMSEFAASTKETAYFPYRALAHWTVFLPCWEMVNATLRA